MYDVWLLHEDDVDAPELQHEKQYVSHENVSPYCWKLSPIISKHKQYHDEVFAKDMLHLSGCIRQGLMGIGDHYPQTYQCPRSDAIPLMNMN